jgi:hypothetical protein
MLVRKIPRIHSQEGFSAEGVGGWVVFLDCEKQPDVGVLSSEGMERGLSLWCTAILLDPARTKPLPLARRGNELSGVLRACESGNRLTRKINSSRSADGIRGLPRP